MDIGVLTVNPYLAELQNERNVNNIMLVLDYVESKQMTALIQGISEITEILPNAKKVQEAGPELEKLSSASAREKFLEDFKNDFNAGTTSSG